MSGRTGSVGDAWARIPKRVRTLALPVTVLLLLVFYPNYYQDLFNALGGGTTGQLAPTVPTMVVMCVYVMMALGLNVVVGYAGLLDLGYAAFFAIGSYTYALLASNQFNLHLSFWLVLFIAAGVAAACGALLGAPTLRLRGDYLAIVTLAFGEIIAVVAVNGQSVPVGGGMTLTAGNLGISAVDSPYFPGIGSFNLLNLRPWYWLIFAILLFVLFVNLRLRDSRLGRAWIALREDEVAAVSMGIPLVKTKLLAYAIGAAFGGMAGAFFGTYYTVVNAGQFQFGFSIFILAMVIIGGLGSIWGAVVGGLVLGYINNYLIPSVLNNLPAKFGLHFQLTSVEFGIFGFLLVIMMVLRPQGLIPERRRRLELTARIAAEDAQLVETQGPAGGPT
jgi:branched-chain amino acid transport system permease protein